MQQKKTQEDKYYTVPFTAGNVIKQFITDDCIRTVPGNEHSSQRSLWLPRKIRRGLQDMKSINYEVHKNNGNIY